ncbi:MAG: class I SAM-dependent methyltransferase [Candidatus Hodarchaeota archaeon]
MTRDNRWADYIAGLRNEEIRLIKNYLNGKVFQRGLEVGAGNGFQNRLLTEFVNDLTCTEFNELRLVKSNNEKIKYMICDAEIIDSYFQDSSFDFIFSAHMMEHLPNPENAIRGTYNLLDDEGISIHIIPSSFNAFLRILLWYPNLVISLARKYLFSGNYFRQENDITGKDNNLKTKRSYNRSKIRKHIIPRPHGVSKNVFVELFAFSRKRWIREFEKGNFLVLKIIKGPVHSGYGIGFCYLRDLLYSLGLTGEYIYIMKKNDSKN